MVQEFYVPWNLSELKEPAANAPTVLSTFSCGGGSSMGYKLAGFKLIGCVEIDPKMLAVYRKNLTPPMWWNMPIQEFNKIPIEQLPNQVKNLDVLDGSPPCSVFSMAGSREDKWGSEHKFREGQAVQRLDDLFFHFIEAAKNLRPRFVVAENVKGMILGNAKGYVKEIFEAFDKAGYNTQMFLLNSAFMGVPQARERVFFICKRKDLQLNNLKLNFNSKPISISSAFEHINSDDAKKLPAKVVKWWKSTPPGKLFSVCGANTGKMNRKLHPAKPSWTQTSTPNIYHWKEPRGMSSSEVIRIQSFPDDYNFLDQKPVYVCGMSVPPYMMRSIANEIINQWIVPERKKQK